MFVALTKWFEKSTSPVRVDSSARSEANKYELLVQGVRDCSLVLLDSQGCVLIWNKGAERLQGYSSAETMGAPYAFFFSNEDVLHGGPERLLKRAVEQGSAQEEGWRYRKDGSRFWAKVFIGSLTGTAGEPRGFAAITYDISKQKQAEDLLKVAKESAEAANRAKSSFLANMSHEIRTPLGAVLGFSELLNDPLLSEEERREFSSTIQRNGSQLSSLISDILDLSKIEAERLELEELEFSTPALLREMTEMAEAEIASKQKQIVFQLNYDPALPRIIWSDPTRLRQVLTNLIGNAVKFTERGFISMTVTHESSPQDSNRHRLSFVIADSGTGMSTDQQTRIFQPFSQGDSSITRKFGGTGLGLVLSRQIARLMGGDLDLMSSRLGEGSVFKFSLTVRVAEATERGERAFRVLIDHQAQPDHRQLSLLGIRVLLAEDAPDNQILIRRFLESAHAKVEVASNGQEAVQKALNGGFDVILMDMQMPELDGLQATRILRQKGCRIPIIAVTANALLEERMNCLHAGCDDHLPKPISRAKLLTKIIEQVAQKGELRHGS